eukprot:scaffold3937_cov143-Skeletonema_dohrnii-CCMP3373.AAC.1
MSTSKYFYYLCRGAQLPIFDTCAKHPDSSDIILNSVIVIFVSESDKDIFSALRAAKMIRRRYMFQRRLQTRDF